MSAALKSQGLPPEMIPEEIKKGQTMLRNILDHDTGRWILKSHRDARCEYSLTQMKNDIYRSRIIDRTFIDENDVRWIIDYKTGEHMGANLENFFNNERDVKSMNKRIIFRKGILNITKITEHQLQMTFEGEGSGMLEYGKNFPISGEATVNF